MYSDKNDRFVSIKNKPDNENMEFYNYDFQCNFDFKCK